MKRSPGATNLDRIVTHVKEAGFGILTSWQHDVPLAGNQAAFAQLKRMVRGAGYGFIELDGCWEDETAETHESFLLIPNRQSRPAVASPRLVISDFEDWLMRMATRFDQDAFVFGESGRIFLLNRQGNRTDLETRNGIAQTWSAIRKGTRRGQSFILATRHAPESSMEAMRRQADGEIWSLRALKRYMEVGRTHERAIPNLSKHGKMNFMRHPFPD